MQHRQPALLFAADFRIPFCSQQQWWNRRRRNSSSFIDRVSCGCDGQQIEGESAGQPLAHQQRQLPRWEARRICCHSDHDIAAHRRCRSGAQFRRPQGVLACFPRRTSSKSEQCDTFCCARDSVRRKLRQLLLAPSPVNPSQGIFLLVLFNLLPCALAWLHSLFLSRASGLRTAAAEAAAGARALLHIAFPSSAHSFPRAPFFLALFRCDPFALLSPQLIFLRFPPRDRCAAVGTSDPLANLPDGSGSYSVTGRSGNRATHTASAKRI